MLRQILQVRGQNRARSAMQCVWYGLCKEVAVKRAEYRVRKNRQRYMLRGQMRLWRR